MSYKGACGHKEACSQSESLITIMSIKFISLLCVHSFHTGAEVMVHVQLKLTLSVCLKVRFSQESVRVKTLLAKHTSQISNSETSPGIVEAAQQLPSGVQHWKAAVASLGA